MIFLRLVTLFTADVLGFRQALKGNYRSALMYALTMGGIFVLPIIDLIDDYFPLPRIVMLGKRKLLSLGTLLVWKRFIPNMTIQWFIIYFVTGEFRKGPYERIRLLFLVFVSMVLAGEVESFGVVTKYLDTKTMAVSLALYYLDFSTLTISMNPYTLIISNLYHIAGITLMTLFNMTVFFYAVHHPVYLTVYLFFDPKYEPRETWSKEEIENACFIFFVNEKLYYILIQLYARFLEYV